ncbi:hypothetical protein NDA10_005382 [Ustilago hordei]|nr:hypothetical protein NDA10_005382 [Ustilago hordei]
MYCNYEQNDWANLLDTAAFVYNNTVHNSIGVSPFFACYGWNPKAHPDIPQRLGVNDPAHHATTLPDEDLDFEVEALIDKRSHNGTTEYKVLWRGYSEEAASWEPVENLNCPDLIQEYEVSEGDSLVSVDDDEVDGVGDEIGDVDDNEVDGVGDKVGGVNTSVQCVDLMLEVIPGPQWTTAFGSILIQTANLLWAPLDVR